MHSFWEAIRVNGIKNLITLLLWACTCRTAYQSLSAANKQKWVITPVHGRSLYPLFYLALFRGNSSWFDQRRWLRFIFYTRDIHTFVLLSWFCYMLKTTVREETGQKPAQKYIKNGFSWVQRDGSHQRDSPLSFRNVSTWRSWKKLRCSWESLKRCGAVIVKGEGACARVLLTFCDQVEIGR